MTDAPLHPTPEEATMDDPERDEPEAEAEDAGDLELEPDEVEDVKGGLGGVHVGPPGPGG
jgi:hypothetical protein